MKIVDIRITPVAVPDMSLLNTNGVHGAFFLRSIIEVECDDGTIGFGETYGAAKTVEDPVRGRDAMAELSAMTDLPLSASKKCLWYQVIP